MFEQAEVSDNEQYSSDDEVEIDQASERSQGRDTVQECSDDEQEAIVTTTNQQYYISKDNSTKWSALPPQTNVRTRSENIIRKKPGIERINSAIFFNSLKQIRLYYVPKW